MSTYCASCGQSLESQDAAYSGGLPVCAAGCPGGPAVIHSLINLTPHAIHVVGQDGSPVITVPPSGTVARCNTTRETIATVRTAGQVIPVNRTGFGAVDGLPESVPGTLYIVSSLVAQAATDRTDLLIPDDTVRDAEGRIIGCQALARI